MFVNFFCSAKKFSFFGSIQLSPPSLLLFITLYICFNAPNFCLMINNFLLSDTTFHRSMCTHGAFNFLPLKKIIIIYLSYLLGHTCDKAVYHLLTATFLKNVLDAALDQFREKKRSIYDYCFTYFRQWLLIFLVFFAQLINQLSSAPLLYCFFSVLFLFFFVISHVENFMWICFYYDFSFMMLGYMFSRIHWFHSVDLYFLIN